jgi:hypothetical protein
MLLVVELLDNAYVPVISIAVHSVDVNLAYTLRRLVYAGR